MRKQFSKTFTCEEATLDKYKWIYNRYNLAGTITHKSFFLHLLSRFELDLLNDKDLHSPEFKAAINKSAENPISYFTKTQSESENEDRVAKVLKEALNNELKKHPEQYNGLLDLCIQLASKILSCQTSNEKAINLGRKIYSAASDKKNARSSLTLSNIMELESIGFIPISDFFPLSNIVPKSVIKSYESLERWSKPRNSLTKFYNNFLKKIESCELEDELNKVLKNLDKALNDPEYGKTETL
ncbi:hypothetical protein QP794_25695 [Paenibacillus sp. UMB7766-LJ446]|uniref:hypothetical protein n=1 Tax=Paenibacillus sp. UMB7766-LJ446 TaxID=3046313 RepID=UPI00254F7ECE|nr:hypothetical protein [Paenibacillus sp. UMB7766-LJ446]MDK8193489.1 hypothetical protein [Paenibacillus sp. UMB7766-LJ446]